MTICILSFGHFDQRRMFVAFCYFIELKKQRHIHSKSDIKWAKNSNSIPFH